MMDMLKLGAFGPLMATLIWCVTGCGGWLGYEPDNRTFDELPVVEFEVTRVSVAPKRVGYIPFPYRLLIHMRRITGGGREYRFYSDEKCSNPISVNNLVTINGKPPSGVEHSIYAGGGGFGVYLDFLPKEEDVAEFYQEWFFAKAIEPPSYREKIRFLTKSMPITISPSLVEEMVTSEE